MENVPNRVNTFEQSTELYVKKILAGDIENVRSLLIEAIECLGYDIIEDEPNIIARRESKGWGTWYASADVLDYAASLTVRLKPLSAHSTRAVFDYSIKHPRLGKGDKEVVLQEANTIAAITKTHSIEKTCSVCETESTDDSKFCRQCGAPLTSEKAEIEVLRMMAETRAGKVSVIASAFMMPVAIILILVTIILSFRNGLDPEGLVVLLTLSGAVALLAMVSSIFGWNRLKRALEKSENELWEPSRREPASLKTGELHELPPKRMPISVTEGTTNLLDDELIEHREREKVPVSNRRETNDLG